MTVTPLPSIGSPATAPFEPDAPIESGAPAADAFGSALWSALNSATDAFHRADAAEHAFVQGKGGLQELVLERAQADVMLAVATTAASRATQSLSAIFNIQV
jgi:flagellar hook-basal body complex protein FliE